MTFWRILKEEQNPDWNPNTDDLAAKSAFVFTGEIYNDAAGPVEERMAHLAEAGGCHAAEKVG